MLYMSYKKFFNVGGHLFRISSEESLYGIFGLLKNYKPFEVNDAVSDNDTIFGLHIDSIENFIKPKDIVLKLKFDGEATGIELYEGSEGKRQDEEKRQNNSYFVFRSPDMNRTDMNRIIAVMVHNDELKENRIFVDREAGGLALAAAVNNAVMLMYAFYTSCMDTLLIHAAAVSCRDRNSDGLKGYVFLGRSGTGKSTHSRLWLKNIEDCELMNDDNPVLRITPEGVMVYGSPWSGKTPCYKNVVLPLGGIVRLMQAPQNEIKRLGGIEAYAALVPSASSMKWKRELADGQHRTFGSIIEKVPVYLLKCLPDNEAAFLCHETIVK